MDVQEIKNIEKNKVAVGQVFASFKALCEFVGVKPKSGGKERKYIEKRLRCYFDWEKAERSRELTISAVFYDNPRPYEDERRGVHTTVENEPMQYLVLLTSALFESDFTKRKMLLQMGLVPEEIRKNYRTAVYQNYEDKVSELLESALTQLKKRGYISYKTYMCALHTGYVLTSKEEKQYDDILKSVLAEYNVEKIRLINMQGRGELFWRDVNKKCQELLGQVHIGRQYHLERKAQITNKTALWQNIASYLPLETTEREAVLQDPQCELVLRRMVYDDLQRKVFDSLVKNYGNSHEKAIGIADAPNYQKDLREIQRLIAAESLREK